MYQQSNKYTALIMHNLSSSTGTYREGFTVPFAFVLQPTDVSNGRVAR